MEQDHRPEQVKDFHRFERRLIGGACLALTVLTTATGFEAGRRNPHPPDVLQIKNPAAYAACVTADETLAERIGRARGYIID